MINPIRSIIAVLGGIAVVSLVAEALEFTLVTAAAGGPVTDLDAYFAIRNRPAILGTKLVYNSAAALLGGYMAAKVAGQEEIAHAGVAAAIQTVALIWGFTMSEYARFTPVWTRIALVFLTGPAMVAGAWIRARAAGNPGTAGAPGS